MTAVERPWPPGAATGVGSQPGTDIRAALQLVLDELPGLPYLPELPERGPGGGMIGRTAALLVDLHADLQPSGWRLVDRPGLDQRRAMALLRQDLDVLEELTQGYAGALKIQVAGPWTLAAGLELVRGARALSDPGACRDLAASLAAGLAAHVGEVAARVPGARVILQLDEPALPGVLAGRVPTVSGLGTLRAVPEPVATETLKAVVAVASVPVVVHCCAPRVPLGVIAAAGADGVSVDMSLVDAAADEQFGAAIEAGHAVFCGVVPATDARLSDPAGTVGSVRRWWGRLGFPPERLATSVVITPTCGLAGASPAHARAALAHARAAARVLLDDPEG